MKRKVVQCPALSNPTNGAVSYSSRNYGDVASYTCNTGYNMAGSSTRTCQSSGSWSYSAPSCRVVQCPFPNNPTNGAVSYISRNYGDVATYSCNAGYNLAGSSTQTCQSSGSWSPSAPTCDLGQCPMLTAPTNGIVSGSNFYGGVLTFTCNVGYNLVGFSTLSFVQCSVLAAPDNGGMNGGNNYQDVVTFSCNLGYEIVGSSSVTCQADATWSNNVPTCTRVQCPALQSPTNGGSSGSNYYQDVMSFTCDSGYELDGSATITCQADRTWADSAPSCPRVQCPLLAAPDNGDMSGENYYQDELTFWCDLGYELVGPSSMTCQADRTWSDNVPTCARVQCPALQSPTNGGSSGSNYYQDVMSFTCDSGYELDGSATITCQADRTWTDSAPSCPPIQCPLLAAPDNGQQSGENYYQDVLTFWCDPGYELVGLPSLTCQADRTWTGNVPTCTRVQCPVLSSPVNGISSGSNFYQDVVTSTCDRGYDLIGDSSSTCQADRTWSSNAPSCNGRIQ
ncbi:P-selectin-like [Branchiostoma floridae x Branchiostoma japonicum]